MRMKDRLPTIQQRINERKKEPPLKVDHAGRPCGSGLRVGHVGRICRSDVSVGCVGRTCRSDMSVGHVGRTCRSDMSVGHVDFVCRSDLRVDYAGRPCGCLWTPKCTLGMRVPPNPKMYPAHAGASEPQNVPCPCGCLRTPKWTPSLILLGQFRDTGLAGCSSNAITRWIFACFRQVGKIAKCEPGKSRDEKHDRNRGERIDQRVQIVKPDKSSRQRRTGLMGVGGETVSVSGIGETKNRGRERLGGFGVHGSAGVFYRYRAGSVVFLTSLHASLLSVAPEDCSASSTSRWLVGKSHRSRPSGQRTASVGIGTTLVASARWLVRSSPCGFYLPVWFPAHCFFFPPSGVASWHEQCARHLGSHRDMRSAPASAAAGGKRVSEWRRLGARRFVVSVCSLWP